MKRIRLPFVVLGVLCAVVWYGCSDDSGDNDILDDGKADVGIVGTWKFVSREVIYPEAVEIPPDLPAAEEILSGLTYTFKDDGTFSSVLVTQSPEFTTTSKGTYKILGDKLTLETMEINIGSQPPVSASISFETTFKRDGNGLIFTYKDEALGQTVTVMVVYEKQ